MTIEPLKNEESGRIKSNISQIFESIAEKYELKKYPNDEYEKALINFSNIENLSFDQIKSALKWKWGHSSKKNYPASHRQLIHAIFAKWSSFLQFRKSGKFFDAETTFNWWLTSLPSKPYITIAFITHLVHFKAEGIPLIDQHNFRAMNSLLKDVRPSHKKKMRPSNWQDILDLMHFMKSLHHELPQVSASKMDRFLMMYGKHSVPH